MIMSFKNIQKALRLITFLAFFLTSFAPYSSAWPWDGSKYLDEASKELAHEEKKSQQKAQKVSKYMDKARELRYEGNFESARRHAEKALRIDPSSRTAEAFLDNLDREKELYEKYQANLRAEQEREKQRKKFEKEQARREREQRKLDRKTEPLIEKARMAADSGELDEARNYASKALRIDGENTEAADILRSISEMEEKERREEEVRHDREMPERKADEAVTAEAEKERATPVEAETVTGDVTVGQEDRPVAQETVIERKDVETLQLESGNPIVVDGDKVEYFEEEGKVVAEGNVSITYGDAVLKCDRIEVDTLTRKAECRGNVRIVKTEGTLVSESIKYDYSKKEGEVVGGVVKAYPFFGSADKAAKVGENEFLLKNGYISTCDHDRPHYHLKAEEIRVFPGEKVIAKNVIAYLGSVPVMWIPYYYHPVIDTRAKVQFIPGVTSDWGYFLLSAWRAYVKGDSKVDILLDYREKKGFAGGADFYYNAKDFGAEGLGSGLLRAYFINENGWGTYDPTPYRNDSKDERTRQRIQWKHRIDFDPQTVGMLEFNKMTDKWVIKDYLYKEYEEMERIPPNYISFITNQRNFTFSVEANKRFNDFYTVVERLPEVTIDVPDQRLWKTPFYYSTRTSATSFRKLYATEEEERYELTNRLDSFHKLSFVSGLGPLSVVPYGTFRETLYSKRKYSSDPAARMVIGGGVDTFIRFHKVYDVQTDLLGLEINKLRHIISPRVEYFHKHQPTVGKSTLFQMDDIDAITKENGVRLSLENKLQTKRQSPTGESGSVDLLRSRVSVDYLFSMRKDKFELEENGDFRNLEMLLELRPYDWLYIDGELNVDPKNQAMRSGSVEMAMNPTDNFRLDMGYRYEKMLPDSRNQLTMDMRYKISPKWSIEIYERFDLEKGDFEEQQYTITRDLHCWEVELTYDLEGSDFVNDDFTFWLAFKIKAFPDLPIGLNRSFTKRAPGVPQTQGSKY